jgi:hypothetical protein
MRGDIARCVPRRLRGLAFTLVLTAAMLAAAPSSYGANTLYKGAFKCSDGRVMAGVRVELWQTHKRWLPEIWPNFVHRNTTRSDANGAWAFRISGDESNWRIRVVLVGEHAAVKDFPWNWNWYTHTLRSQNNVPVRDYGTQVVSGYQCAVWNGFSEAGREYQATLGSAPPQGVTSVVAGAPTAGKPFAPYDVVWWPSGHPVYKRWRDSTVSTARHEFAHAVRHVLDGSFGHFTFDSGYFWYLRNHSATSCERTNSGFAFNEGWAEWWAGQVMEPCETDPNTGLIERNVAAELARLEARCASRKLMVGTLAANRGKIHSIDEFSRALGCPSAVKSIGKPRKPTLAILRESQPTLRAGRQLVSQLGKSVKTLRRQTLSAERLAGRDVPCPKRPCEDRIERGLRPVLLGAQLDAARTLKSKFAFLAKPKSIRRLAELPLSRQIRMLQAKRTAAVSASKRIAVRALGKARTVARRLGADASSLGTLRQSQAAAARGDSAVLGGLTPVQLPSPRRVGPTPSILEPPTVTPTEPPTEPPPGPPDELEFADWLAVDANVATGTLKGASISLSGSNVVGPPGSTVDGSSTVFNRADFSPPLATGDAVGFYGDPGYSYVLTFGFPRRDPILHLGSLASTLAFPPGTSITRVSGEDQLSVSGNTVTGALEGSDDANGTVRLEGTFQSVPFSTTPTYTGSPDGIYLQVGAPG